MRNDGRFRYAVRKAGRIRNRATIDGPNLSLLASEPLASLLPLPGTLRALTAPSRRRSTTGVLSLRLSMFQCIAGIAGVQVSPVGTGSVLSSRTRQAICWAMPEANGNPGRRCRKLRVPSHLVRMRCCTRCFVPASAQVCYMNTMTNCKSPFLTRSWSHK